jgi:hypothetical protein
MESSVHKMGVQLKRWGLEIDRLAAETQMAGVHAEFDSLLYIDELKVLHAIAQTKFDAFRALEDTRRARLKAEMKSAWHDLETALGKRERGTSR